MTTERVNLLVPAEAVPRLSIPDRALSTGAPDPVRVDFRGTSLPYDRGTALALRRRRRVAPFLLAYTILGAAVAVFAPAPPGVHLFWSSGLVGLSFTQALWHTPTVPSALPGGDLFLRNVPADVAAEWIDRNPGVHLVERRPAVRRFPPRAYPIAAVLLLLAAVQAAIVLAVAVAGEPASLWLLAPALATAGLTAAYKSIPFDHVRFTHSRV